MGFFRRLFPLFKRKDRYTVGELNRIKARVYDDGVEWGRLHPEDPED